MKKNHNPPPPLSSPSVVPRVNPPITSPIIPSTLKPELKVPKPHYLGDATADKMPFIHNDMVAIGKDLTTVKQEKLDMDPLDAAVERFLGEPYFPSLDNFSIDC